MLTRTPSLLVAAALTVLVVSGTCSAGISYSGALSSSSGLYGAEDWTSGASISWTVEQIGSQWSYTYEINVANKDVSHFIIELSDGAVKSDFWDVSLNDVTYELEHEDFDTYNSSGQGNSNPGIPDDIYGMKIEPDVEEEYFLKFSFTTYRQPVWADFYAKDGKTSGNDVYMYNVGFGDPDSDPDMDTNPAAHNSVDFHILAPDDVPEPATLALIGLGGIGMLLRKRR